MKKAKEPRWTINPLPLLNDNQSGLINMHAEYQRDLARNVARNLRLMDSGVRAAVITRSAGFRTLP